MTLWIHIFIAIGLALVTLDFGVRMNAARTRTVIERWRFVPFLYPIVIPCGLVMLWNHPVIEPAWQQFALLIAAPFAIGFLAYEVFTRTRTRSGRAADE